MPDMLPNQKNKSQMRYLLIVIVLFCSCKVQMTTWQRCGTFTKHGNAYVFKPYEQWHKFDSTKALPDTVYQFIYSKRKP